MIDSTPRVRASAREYLIIGGALAVVAGSAWAYTLYMASGMDHMQMSEMWMAPTGSHWTVWDFWMLFSMWAVMMSAMMLPSALPMVMVYAGLARTRRRKGQSYTPTLVFVLGYLIAWTGFSLAISLVQWQLHKGGLLSPMMAAKTHLVSGLLLMVAGIYQWSPYKNACLTKCRSPIGFLLAEWREGTAGALTMGIRHGAYCLGCCWALMLILFAVGVMNMLWVLLIAAFVLAEKVLPAPNLIRAVSGGALAAWGGYWIYLHFALPA